MYILQSMHQTHPVIILQAHSILRPTTTIHTHTHMHVHNTSYYFHTNIYSAYNNPTNAHLHPKIIPQTNLFIHDNYPQTTLADV